MSQTRAKSRESKQDVSSAEKESEKKEEKKQPLKKKQSKIEKEHDLQGLQDMANLMRIQVIEMTSAAGSGHPTTCSSSADFAAVLFFDPLGMHYYANDPANFANDRLVLSKGHAAPLMYSAWQKAGYLKEEDLKTLRKIDSKLEGHPTTQLPFVDIASGSLGQGLGVACGMAYSSKKFDKINNTYFVICGDGELAEGSNWEAVDFASHYKLDNIIAFVDVNKYGQSNDLGAQEKMFKAKFDAAGWHTQIIDGHNIQSIVSALQKARDTKNVPSVIIGKTVKGKNMGPNVENKMGLHGQALGKESENSINHLKGLIKNPDIVLHGIEPEIKEVKKPEKEKFVLEAPTYKKGELLATRQSYGLALKKLGEKHKSLVVLDADLKNSTFSETFKLAWPDNFVECFIAEQNMISVAAGLACRGKMPFASTFSCFFTRAFDQLRIASQSSRGMAFCGSHCGASVGEDGLPSMGLQDIAEFRALSESIVLYPSDAVSTERAVELAANVVSDTVYIRTNRPKTVVFYDNNEHFEIGKSKVVRQSPQDKVLIVAAGITFNESLAAAEILKKDGIDVRIIDLFSVKPLDKDCIWKNALECGKKVITVEDHYVAGGINEAICSELGDKQLQIYRMAIEKKPKSGPQNDVLNYCGITASHIVEKVKAILK